MPAVIAATCQLLSTGSPVDDGHRLASYDTSLVVSGGVDCGRRRRNVYDKQPRRYAKDNRTAHLTARRLAQCDRPKSLAYVVTNNKRLRFVLLKLTTDIYEASRGLFATAELLVTKVDMGHTCISRT